jgi:hypothetical protein
MMRSLRALPVVLLGWLVTPTLATDATSCGELPCRANGIPYASEAGGVIIVPNEALFVEIEVAHGAIVGAVPRPDLLTLETNTKGNVETHVIRPHPDAKKVPFSITFHLLGGVRDQTLTWQHTLDRPMTFDAYAISPDAKQLAVKCQLGARGWETWTGPFDAIELRNFRFIDRSTCK